MRSEESPVVRVPVTADLEADYGDITRTAAALVSSGAVGSNFEDKCK